MKRDEPSSSTSPRAPVQLRMNFSGENRLAALLRAGQFTVLIEQNTPPGEQPLDVGLALSQSLAKRIASTEMVAGITLTDRLRTEAAHDPVEAGERLAEASQKPVVLVLSGKGSNPDRMRDCLARAASSRHLRSVLAVSGDRSDRHVTGRGGGVAGQPRASARGRRERLGGRIPQHPGGYLDSVQTLGLIRASTQGVYAGAVVNPFKYNAADQYLQYYKLLRKVATGAQFIVAQAGWDMKKYQELQWFLRLREVEIPVVARLALLTVEEIHSLHDGPWPGVHLARLFCAMLQRESNLSATQCIATQLQRIGLQVAGCRLMGYSGVQIAGIRDAKIMDMVLGQIQQAVNRYQHYDAWVRAWNEFHSNIEFAPMTGAFYVFRDLLRPDRQDYQREHCELAGMPLPEPASLDRVRAFWLRLLLAPAAPHWLSVAGRFLACRGCAHADCGQEHCFHLCPHDCPKGLAYGACGGSYPDGTCEFGHTICFYHRVVALAAARHELDRLEEGVAAEP